MHGERAVRVMGNIFAIAQLDMSQKKLRLPNGSVVVMTPCAVEIAGGSVGGKVLKVREPVRRDRVVTILPSGKVGRELVKKRAPLCVNQSVTTSTPSTRRRTRVSTVGKQPDPFVLHTAGNCCKKYPISGRAPRVVAVGSARRRERACPWSTDRTTHF